jgi:predicted nucleic acid-binding protein
MTTSAPTFLVDTNVLIYAYDAKDPAKMRRAIDVLSVLRMSQSGSVSVQVLGEFYNNITRKPAVPLSTDEARAVSIRYARSWPVFDLTLRTYLEAIRGVPQHSLSYFDALIWATALQNGVPNVITEDQQHGRVIDGVRFYNPFDERFDVGMLS